MSKEIQIVTNGKKSLLLLVFIFFGLGNFSSFGQNCKAELSVEKDRHVRSAAENGTEFSLLIKNYSSRILSFDLSTINKNEPCSPKNRSATTANVNLNTQIQKEKMVRQATNRISMGAGKSYSFKVKVMAPKGTPFQIWGCVEVQAKSEYFHEIITQILSVYVPDPSQG